MPNLKREKLPIHHIPRPIFPTFIYCFYFIFLLVFLTLDLVGEKNPVTSYFRIYILLLILLQCSWKGYFSDFGNSSTIFGFNDFVFILVNIGPHGGKCFKKLLMQIAFELFPPGVSFLAFTSTFSDF